MTLEDYHASLRHDRLRRDTERFWSRVDKDAPNGCWIFTAPPGCEPYETVDYHTTSFMGNPMGAHRVSWELINALYQADFAYAISATISLA